jgi:hypothetical protein
MFSGIPRSVIIYVKPHQNCFLVKDTSTNTIGVEFGSRIVHIADKSIKLQIWDTAGQVCERVLPHVILPWVLI